jgi:gliding motility-associated protein GldL
MGFITEFVESPGYKKIMGKVYGWGASVVLAGALFKIMHYPGAEIMLLLGMGTEIIIFFLSAFEPPHEQPDWSLVYPELRGLEPKGPRNKGGGGGSDLAALVESGNLDQEVVDKLADGIKKLSATTSQLADVSNASLATESYLQNIKQAGDAVGKFSNVQLKTAKTLEETSGKIAEAGSKVAEVGSKVAEELNNSGKSFAESVKSSGNQLV